MLPQERVSENALECKDGILATRDLTLTEIQESVPPRCLQAASNAGGSQGTPQEGEEPIFRGELFRNQRIFPACRPKSTTERAPVPRHKPWHLAACRRDEGGEEI